MAVMALDHVRDFFAAGGPDPRDVSQASLFMTRWITHFCAPVFVFLAGTSARLSHARGLPTREVARFLLLRGFWLVVLELSVVRFAWIFDLEYSLTIAGVLWAIGWSMVVLSALVRLPLPAVAAIGAVIVAGHNLLDGIDASALGAGEIPFLLLHQPGPIPLAERVFFVVSYPVLPWIGVIALGYAFGACFERDAQARRRLTRRLGLAACAAFVALRGSNLYGDPRPFVVQGTLLESLLAFISCEKYPPSLLYLLMTLGPVLVALPWLEQARGRAAAGLVTIGRVPLFYYVIHLFWIHGLAIAAAQLTIGDARWLIGGTSFFAKPPGYGFSLPVVYAVWVGVVLSLYPLCRWFAGLKQRQRAWWLRYL